MTQVLGVFLPSKGDILARYKRQYDDAVLKNIREEVRKHIARQRPRSVVNEKGKFYGSQEAVEIIAKTGIVVRRISEESESIRFPFNEKERLMFGRMLVDQFLQKEKCLKIIAPVCPDYGEGEFFHSQIGNGVSYEAQAAVVATELLDRIFTDGGINANIQILLADTEGDHPDILKRCAGGDLEKYLVNCNESVDAIRKMLEDSSTIQVLTFTEVFGDDFHEVQHSYEDLMRDAYISTPSFKAEIEKISGTRKVRHSQILGREERNSELAIRYMAQYAALGTIGRRMKEAVMFLNYDTPNRIYYNAGAYKGIALSDADQEIVPILGSIIKR